MRLLALAVFLVPAIAAADAPLALTVATHGSTLDLTFKNTSAAPVKLTTHVRAGLDHYDWLTVELAGKPGKRTLHFIESRTKAIPIDETIAAGASLTRSVDLVSWSLRGDNAGGPLEPGAYQVEVTWDMSRESSGPKQKLTASTTLALAEARETACKEKPAIGAAKLDLLARQVGATKVQIGLHNTDSAIHCVHGIIRTHETQNDWLTVSFTAVGETTRRTIGFSGDREKSYPVTYELAPGATVWNTWDLADWNKRRPAAKPLPVKTTLWMTATWNAAGSRDVWRGIAATGFGMKLP